MCDGLLNPRSLTRGHAEQGAVEDHERVVGEERHQGGHEPSQRHHSPTEDESEVLVSIGQPTEQKATGTNNCQKYDYIEDVCLHDLPIMPSKEHHSSADNEVITLSRVHSYYYNCNLPLF